MATGTYWLVAGRFPSSLATYPIGGHAGTKLYIGLVAFAVNIVVVIVGSVVALAIRGREGERAEGIAA